MAPAQASAVHMRGHGAGAAQAGAGAAQAGTGRAPAHAAAQVSAGSSGSSARSPIAGVGPCLRAVNAGGGAGVAQAQARRRRDAEPHIKPAQVAAAQRPPGQQPQRR